RERRPVVFRVWSPTAMELLVIVPMALVGLFFSESFKSPEPFAITATCSMAFVAWQRRAELWPVRACVEPATETVVFGFDGLWGREGFIPLRELDAIRVLHDRCVVTTSVGTTLELFGDASDLARVRVLVQTLRATLDERDDDSASDVILARLACSLGDD